MSRKTKKRDKSKEIFSLAKAFEQATTISLTLVTLPVILLLIGVVIDKKLETTPIFIIIGVVVGISFGIYRAIHLSKNIKLEADKKNE